MEFQFLFGNPTKRKSKTKKGGGMANVKRVRSRSTINTKAKSNPRKKNSRRRKRRNPEKLLYTRTVKGANGVPSRESRVSKVYPTAAEVRKVKNILKTQEAQISALEKGISQIRKRSGNITPSNSELKRIQKQLASSSLTPAKFEALRKKEANLIKKLRKSKADAIKKIVQHRGKVRKLIDKQQAFQKEYDAMMANKKKSIAAAKKAGFKVSGRTIVDKRSINKIDNALKKAEKDLAQQEKDVKEIVDSVGKVSKPKRKKTAKKKVAKKATKKKATKKKATKKKATKKKATKKKATKKKATKKKVSKKVAKKKVVKKKTTKKASSSKGRKKKTTKKKATSSKGRKKKTTKKKTVKDLTLKQAKARLSTLSGKGKLKKNKSKSFNFKVANRRYKDMVKRTNPTYSLKQAKNEGVKGLVQSYMQADMREIAGFAIGGIGHGFTNDIAVKVVGDMLGQRTLLARIASLPMGDSVFPLLGIGLIGHGLLKYVGPKAGLSQEWISDIIKGWSAATVVGSGIKAYDMVAPSIFAHRAALASGTVSGVDYTPMSGVDYTPMSGVDYTPMSGISVVDPDQDAESPADFGFEESAADFGFEETAADFGMEDEMGDDFYGL